MNACASCGAVIQGRVYSRPLPSDLSALTDDPLALPRWLHVDTICRSCYEGDCEHDAAGERRLAERRQRERSGAAA